MNARQLGLLLEVGHYALISAFGQAIRDLYPLFTLSSSGFAGNLAWQNGEQYLLPGYYTDRQQRLMWA